MGTLLLALASTLSPALSQDQKDVQEVLMAFAAELQNNIRTSKDPNVRPKLLTASKAVFTKDLNGAVWKVPKSKWEAHRQYLENLIAADKKFTSEDTKLERTAWIMACKTVFTYQNTHAMEPPDDKLTTEDAFAELFQAIDKVRKDIAQASSADIRTPAYVGAKQVFMDRLQKAQAPNRDAQKVYTEELIKIDKAYPLAQAPQPAQASAVPSKTKSAPSTSSSKSGASSNPEPPKEEYDFHTEPNNILKAAAKSAFDRALAAKK
jgi:hypothetical protein